MSVRQDLLLVGTLHSRKTKRSFLGRLFLLLAFLTVATALSIVSFRLLIQHDTRLLTSMTQTFAVNTAPVKRFGLRMINHPKMSAVGLGLSVAAGLVMYACRRLR